MPTIPRCVVLAGVAAMLAACGAPHRVETPVTPDGGRLYTAADIAKMQAATAWDVMRRIGVFDLTPSSDGRVARATTRRGRSSLVLPSADEPVMLLDGVEFYDPGILRQISASSLAEVRIYSGIEATVREGTNSGAGLVDIRTKTAPDSD